MKTKTAGSDGTACNRYRQVRTSESWPQVRMKNEEFHKQQNEIRFGKTPIFPFIAFDPFSDRMVKKQPSLYLQFVLLSFAI